jgi:hypothetical protein
MKIYKCINEKGSGVHHFFDLYGKPGFITSGDSSHEPLLFVRLEHGAAHFNQDEVRQLVKILQGFVDNGCT